MSKPTLSLASTVVASPRQVSTDLGDETVILGVEAGTYFGLDEVGARVWALVQEPVSVASLCETLLSEYEVAEEECRRDLLELLEALQDKGLIHVQSTPGAG